MPNSKQKEKYREIIIEIIPHKSQRYNTIGDWFRKDKRWRIRVSRTKKDIWQYHWLIAVHEFIEMFLCRHRGIPESKIAKFDIISDLDDPGASKKAPYYKEHKFATKIERLVAKELKINRKKYEKEIVE